MNIWKFMVHVLLKPGLENFEHYFTIEDAKDSTRKILVVIHEFGKDVGFKINRQKSAASLHINNERSEEKQLAVWLIHVDV